MNWSPKPMQNMKHTAATRVAFPSHSLAPKQSPSRFRSWIWNRDKRSSRFGPESSTQILNKKGQPGRGSLQQTQRFFDSLRWFLYIFVLLGRIAIASSSATPASFESGGTKKNLDQQIDLISWEARNPLKYIYIYIPRPTKTYQNL